ncbi:MAG: hypothetical protein JWQ98_1656 [Chlorobi bacterium]|nr:hypothetical protein [Chlorobiota bacterium]
MPSIKAISGVPDEIEVTKIPCSDKTATIVVTAYYIGTGTVINGAGIFCTLNDSEVTATATTDKHGIVTFTIGELDGKSANYTITTRDAKRICTEPTSGIVNEEDEKHLKLELGSTIKSIRILDGDDDSDITKQTAQYVNLPKDKLLLELASVGNIDRLSTTVRLRIDFEYPGVQKASVMMVAGKDNVAYTENEKKRNPNYKTLPADLNDTVIVATGDEGFAIIPDQFRVSPAGNDLFHFVATDQQGESVITANKLVTRRRVFLQPVLMDNEIVQMPESLQGIDSEYGPQGVDFTILKPIKTPYIQDFYDEKLDTLWQNLTEQLESTQIITAVPHTIVVIFADNLASRVESFAIKVSVTASSTMEPVKFALENRIRVNDDDWFKAGEFEPTDKVDEEEGEGIDEELQEHPAYKEIDLRGEKKLPIEERMNEIKEEISNLQMEMRDLDSESSEYKSRAIRQKELMKEYPLLEEQVKELDNEIEEFYKIMESNIPPPIRFNVDGCILTDEKKGFYTRIKVDLSNYIIKAVKGIIKITYYGIDGSRGGFAHPRKNVVVISTRTNEEQRSEEGQIEVIVHEIGHKVGLVPKCKPENSTKSGTHDLDRHENQFEGSGYNGSHCCAGFDQGNDSYVTHYQQERKKENGQKPACVMFGQTPTNCGFCKHCGAAVRKKDLSGGFSTE